MQYESRSPLPSRDHVLWVNQLCVILPRLNFRYFYAIRNISFAITNHLPCLFEISFVVNGADRISSPLTTKSSEGSVLARYVATAVQPDSQSGDKKLVSRKQNYLSQASKREADARTAADEESTREYAREMLEMRAEEMGVTLSYQPVTIHVQRS